MGQFLGFCTPTRRNRRKRRETHYLWAAKNVCSPDHQDLKNAFTSCPEVRNAHFYPPRKLFTEHLTWKTGFFSVALETTKKESFLGSEKSSLSRNCNARVEVDNRSLFLLFCSSLTLTWPNPFLSPMVFGPFFFSLVRNHHENEWWPFSARLTMRRKSLIFGYVFKSDFSFVSSKKWQWYNSWMRCHGNPKCVYLVCINAAAMKLNTLTKDF